VVTKPPSLRETSRHLPQAVLARIAQHQARRVPDLEARLRAAGFEAGQAPTWETLTRVAPRAKAELASLQQARPHFGGLGPADPPAVIFWSPGGLSEPLVTVAVERLAELLDEAGFRASDRVANGFAYHYTPAGLLVHEALRRIGACVLPIGPQQVALAAEFIGAAGATAYIGTATHLKTLLEATDAMGSELKRPALRIALAGAEPFGDDLRVEIAARWKVPCLDFYGTAESGIVAMECEQRKGMHLHPGVLAETVRPGTGDRTDDQLGELLLTADADELPLLRFATGDWVHLETDPCACGRSTPRVHPQGRVGDSARVRGMLLHGSQVRAMARRARLVACRTTITRQADRDCIELRFCGPADPGTVGQLFSDVCRLRADRVAEDSELAQGEVILIDARVGVRT
jgi:phenylacetate-CoA ligase